MIFERKFIHANLKSWDRALLLCITFYSVNTFFKSLAKLRASRLFLVIGFFILSLILLQEMRETQHPPVFWITRGNFARNQACSGKNRPLKFSHWTSVDFPLYCWWSNKDFLMFSHLLLLIFDWFPQDFCLLGIYWHIDCPNLKPASSAWCL